MSIRIRILFVLAAAWQLLATPPAWAGAQPAELCEAAKLKAASTFSQCRLKSDSVYAKTGDVTKREALYTKCDESLVKSYGAAESKYGAECPTLGDVTDVRDYLKQCSNDVGAATQPGGTVPDYVVDLAACNTSLSSMQAQLTTCTGDKTTCQGRLATAQSGTATTVQVLTGRTFTSSAGIGSTGTMPNNGAVTLTPGVASQAITAGYHNGSGTVAGDADLVAGNIRSGVNLFGVAGAASEATGAATASQVLTGVTFSNTSGASTGTMPNNGTVTLTPGLASQAIAAGYHTGSGTVAGDTDLAAGNIKSGVNLFGVTGTVTAASGAATASQVLTGVTFSNTSGSGTGTMPNNGAVTLTPGTASQAIAAGYHNGSGAVAGDASLVAGNIRSGASIFGVSGSVALATGAATASQVLTGVTFSNTSGSGTGTMPNNGAVTIPPGTSAQAIASGYHNGSGTVAGDANLTAGNIVAGRSIFGVSGSAAPLLKTGQTTSYGTGSDGAVQAGVAAKSFTDNGNGTVTDNRTGLVWAKKSDDGSIHDKDNNYTWGQNASPYSMNGTMVTTYLATLNTPPCFAGACDWRMPNITELLSLVNYETFNPATFDAFNTGCAAGCTVLTCSCTVRDSGSSYYWSSSTYRGDPVSAWGVYFNDGNGFSGTKTGGLYVRAVRGGS